MPLQTRRDFLRLTALGTLGALVLNRVPEFAARAITATPTPTTIPPASKSLGGLFVLLKPNDDAIPAEVLNSPAVKGVTLQVDWSRLQPAPTVVSWEIVEGALARLSAVGKVLALKPIAGTGAPSWLYSAGSKRFGLTPVSDLYHPLDFGKEVTLPLPWDRVMLDEWAKFIAVLGARFDSEAAFVRIAVSGPVFQRAEMYLPGTAIEDWTKLGYSLTNMQNIWQQVLDIYFGAFKKTPFSLDLNPLPDSADKSGTTMNALIPIAIGQYGLRRYPGHFFPATSDFSDVYPFVALNIPGPKNPPALYTSYEQKAGQIFEFLARESQNRPIGLTVSDLKMSRDPGHIQAALDRAKALRAGYIEIPVEWISDAANADLFKEPPALRVPPTATAPLTSTPRKTATPRR